MRNRVVYGLLLITVVGFGLLTRWLPDTDSFIRNYAGDAVWALMIFLGFGFLFRRWSTGQAALIAFLFCVGIELSQLYHATWIDHLRSTRLGGLILGFGFRWSDLVCYAVGVAVGTVSELLGLFPATSNRFTHSIQAHSH